MDIRARIRSVLDRNPEMTMRSVSLAAGLSDSMLQKFLAGSIRTITLETSDKLADALGVDRAWLSHGRGDPDQATDVSKLFDKVPEHRRSHALRVLETFTRTGTDD